MPRVDRARIATAWLLLVACTPLAEMPPPPGESQRFAAAPASWPAAGWPESPPEAQGLRSAELARAVEFARAKGLAIHSLLVVRHGSVVLDATFYPFTAGARHDLASISKSVTSMLVGVAERQRLLRADERIVEVLGQPAASGDPRKRTITVEHLLAMRSGLSCSLSGAEAELRAMMRSADWVGFAIGLPTSAEPGTELRYCSLNYHLLSAAITARTGISEAEFARANLFGPLGISDVTWPADPAGLTHGWGDLQLRPRDLAKLGFLYLHGGSWDGRPIVSTDWIRRTTTPRSRYGASDFYALGWWGHTGSPPGFYEAIGRGGQRLGIWPEKDIVLVMTGGGFEPADLTPFLGKALASDGPLPEDPAAEMQLRAAVRAAAAPPPPLPVGRLPPRASAVSGREIRVEDNTLGLRSITLTFGGALVAQAGARLLLSDRELALAVGLDGVYRPSNALVDGIAPFARGAWSGADEFDLDVNLVGKIDRFALRVRFTGDSAAAVHLEEATGLMSLDLEATVVR